MSPLAAPKVSTARRILTDWLGPEKTADVVCMTATSLLAGEGYELEAELVKEMALAMPETPPTERRTLVRALLICASAQVRA